MSDPSLTYIFFKAYPGERKLPHLSVTPAFGESKATYSGNTPYLLQLLLRTLPLQAYPLY